MTTPRWTMGMMTHAKVIEIADHGVLDVPVQPVDKFEPRGTVKGSAAPYYAVLDNGSNNLVTLRYRLKDVAMRAVEQAFKIRRSGDSRGIVHRRRAARTTKLKVRG